MIERSVRLLFRPDQIVELRMPGTAKGVLGGYFNPDKLIDAVYTAGRVPTAPNIYWTIQQINPELLKRAPNQSRIGETATKDEDVVRYRWLPIDCDPKRKSGINATVTEKASAYDVALRVQAYLACLDFEWMIPSVLADSGNGYHILVPIDCEANAATKELIRRVLFSLNEQFGTDAVTIDRTVYNPARILKAYGTISRKGENTSERPNRVTGLVDVPEYLQVMPLEALEYIAAKASKATLTTASENKPNKPALTASQEVLDESAKKMEEFLAVAGIKHWKRKAHNSGYKWIVECPFNVDHRGTSCAVFILADGSYGFKCLHDGCIDNHWQEFRRKAEASIGHPFHFVDAAPQPVPESTIPVATDAIAASAAPTSKASAAYLETVLASDIAPEEVEWLWENRIPMDALSMFVGDADKGKGVTATDFIARLTTGREMPSSAPNPFGHAISVLVMGAEDALSTVVVPRLIAAGADMDKVHIVKSVSRQGEKSVMKRQFSLDTDLHLIRAKLLAFPDIRLVVIDPISNYLGDVNMNREKEVRKVLTPLRDLAEEMKVTFLAVAHFNKNIGASAIHRVGGAQALTSLPRSSWCFINDPEIEGQYLMMPIKKNVGKKARGLTFRIEETFIRIPNKLKPSSQPKVVWGNETDRGVDDVMGEQADPERRGVGKAKNWLLEYLASGEKPSVEVYEAAAREGISEAALKRGRKEMGVESFKKAYTGAGVWFMRLKNNNAGGCVGASPPSSEDNAIAIEF